MASLYVASAETFAGKSAVCVALAMRMQQDGLRVGYMKPVSRSVDFVEGEALDADTRFIKTVLGLPEPAEILTPVAITVEVEQAMLRGEQPADFMQRVRHAHAQVLQDRDVVLLEGAANLRVGYLFGLSAFAIADVLGVPELVVVRFNEEFIDSILASRYVLGPSLIGVVVNGVPRPQLDYVRNKVRPFLEGEGIRLLGVVPQEQLLQSISVGDLVDIIDGEMLCCENTRDELVENLMVGAMSAAAALHYFRMKPNKAVITGGDRPDIQLAALETSTRCLVLTGRLSPEPAVVEKSAESGVPVILTRHDTLTAINLIQSSFGKTRFQQQKKMRRFQEIMDESFDYPRLYRLLDVG